MSQNSHLIGAIFKPLGPLNPPGEFISIPVESYFKSILLNHFERQRERSKPYFLLSA